MKKRTLPCLSEPAPAAADVAATAAVSAGAVVVTESGESSAAAAAIPGAGLYRFWDRDR